MLFNLYLNKAVQRLPPLKDRISFRLAIQILFKSIWKTTNHLGLLFKPCLNKAFRGLLLPLKGRIPLRVALHFYKAFQRLLLSLKDWISLRFVIQPLFKSVGETGLALDLLFKFYLNKAFQRLLPLKDRISLRFAIQTLFKNPWGATIYGFRTWLQVLHSQPFGEQKIYILILYERILFLIIFIVFLNVFILFCKKFKNTLQTLKTYKTYKKLYKIYKRPDQSIKTMIPRSLGGRIHGFGARTNILILVPRRSQNHCFYTLIEPLIFFIMSYIFLLLRGVFNHSA